MRNNGSAQNNLLLVVLLVLTSALWWSAGVRAQESRSDSGKESGWFVPLFDEISEGFSSRIDVLSFGIVQQPEGSPLNSNNRLEIPRYQLELDLRPDLNLNFRRLELSVKPRFELRWQKWEDGIRQGDSEVDTDVFVNEWLTRYRLTDQLFVSYGRENLQWGPSYLISPSNPFNLNNGQNNPRVEVPGLDYGRIVWIPSFAWTVSLIANIDDGRLEQIRSFHKTYALKLDYTGEEKYFSLIPSYREDNKIRLGFFGGWTVSEALLLYAEGSIPDAIDKTKVLVGGSYTLELGPTLVAEYYYNGGGCTVASFALCFGSDFVVEVPAPDPSVILSPAPEFGEADPADVLIRKNYLLLQYLHTRIRNTTLNLTLRWIRNFDDQSNRMISILEYGLGDHTQLFAIGNVDIGSKASIKTQGKRLQLTVSEDNEFGSLVDYSVFAGVRYTF